ncbi:hypothetical protein BDR26DRAFT_890343 [Obelidium mucronatum]|nr:hypothetical protein BDR26DRAFT_890343 [Obelidium mucronatum]
MALLHAGAVAIHYNDSNCQNPIYMELTATPLASCVATKGCANPKTLCETANADTLGVLNFPQVAGKWIQYSESSGKFYARSFTDSTCSNQIGNHLSILRDTCIAGSFYSMYKGQATTSNPAGAPSAPAGVSPTVLSLITTSQEPGLNAQPQPVNTIQSQTHPPSIQATVLTGFNTSNTYTTAVNQNVDGTAGPNIPSIVGSVAAVVVLAAIGAVLCFTRKNGISKATKKHDVEKAVRVAEASLHH